MISLFEGFKVNFLKKAIIFMDHALRSCYFLYMMYNLPQLSADLKSKDEEVGNLNSQISGFLEQIGHLQISKDQVGTIFLSKFFLR